MFPSIYFQGQVENDRKPAVLAFKAAQYLLLPRMNEIELIAAGIDSSTAISFLN